MGLTLIPHLETADASLNKQILGNGKSTRTRTSPFLQKQEAVGEYVWASMCLACVKFVYMYLGCLSSAVALHILGVG